MAIGPLERRLKFLKQAAHALAVQSPTASANLGAAHDRLLATDDRDVDAPKKEWDALRRDVCGACGNVMIPGWTSRTSHQTRGGKKEKDGSKPSAKPEKHIVYSCMRCDRESIQPLPVRPRKHMQSKAGSTNIEASPVFAAKESVSDDSKVTKSANATSKQRKKARKGGLQAMLEKNKTQNSAPSGLGLDLMDFMQ